MGRPKDTRQLTVSLRHSMRNDLDNAATALRVVGTLTQDMDRGRMLRSMFRWFLSLPESERKNVVLAGWDADDDIDSRRAPAADPAGSVNAGRGGDAGKGRRGVVLDSDARQERLPKPAHERTKPLK